MAGNQEVPAGGADDRAKAPVRRRSLVLAWLLRPLAALPIVSVVFRGSVIRRGWVLSKDD